MSVIIRIILVILAIISIAACSSSSKSSSNKGYSGKSYYNYTKGTLKRKWYKVKPSETLYSIAFRAGVDFKSLAKLNNIKPPYTIFPGQILKLRNKDLRTNTTKSSKNKNNSSKKNGKPNVKVIAKAKTEEYGSSSKSKVNKTLTKNSAAGKKGAIRWRWPAKGKVLSYFSSKDVGNNGIDIGGKHGDPVYAAADGQVVYAGSALRGYGKLIIIKHSDTHLTAYAHNSRLRVKENDWVKSGKRIADMGDTDSETVKLHFEVRYRGNTVDPLKFLPKR